MTYYQGQTPTLGIFGPGWIRRGSLFLCRVRIGGVGVGGRVNAVPHETSRWSTTLQIWTPLEREAKGKGSLWVLAAPTVFWMLGNKNSSFSPLTTCVPTLAGPELQTTCWPIGETHLKDQVEEGGGHILTFPVILSGRRLTSESWRPHFWSQDTQHRGAAYDLAEQHRGIVKHFLLSLAWLGHSSLPLYPLFYWSGPPESQNR